MTVTCCHCVLGRSNAACADNAVPQAGVNTALTPAATPSSVRMLAAPVDSTADVLEAVNIPAPHTPASALNLLLNRSPSRRIVPLDVIQRPFSSYHVAFIDDESPNCRIGKRYLTQLGVLPANITIVSDGTLCAMLAQVSL
jgi:hypothetical protein